jgi:zinc-ribbon domain
VAVTRYCPNCGLERREGERYCRNCGHALGTGETELHASPVAAAPPAPAAPAEPTAPIPPLAPGPIAPPAGPDALPSPPSAPHPVPAGPRAAATQLPFKPLAVAGGAAMILAVFLPWVSIGGSSPNALDVPLQAIWDPNTGDGAIKLGFVVLLLGAVGAGLSFMPNTTRYRRLAGSVGLAVVLAFALQLVRSVDQSGGSFGDALGAVGIGVYLALAGAVALQVSK